MTINAADLEKIDQALSAAEADRGILVELRRRFPHLSWTACDASDLFVPPFRSYRRFDLHLLDSADHCPQITLDPSQATGIVLAARREGR